MNDLTESILIRYEYTGIVASITHTTPGRNPPMPASPFLLIGGLICAISLSFMLLTVYMQHVQRRQGQPGLRAGIPRKIAHLEADKALAQPLAIFRPSQSWEEYERQTHHLCEYITARTGLPLQDLQKTQEQSLTIFPTIQS